MAWRQCVDHETSRGRLYRRLARQHQHFYPRLLNDHHRKFMTYLKSCGHGKFDRIDFRQLNLDRIHESIEDDTYPVRLPDWAAELYQSTRRSASNSNPYDNTGDINPSAKSKKRGRQENKKGNKVDNPNIDKELIAPPSLTYQQIFNPHIRKLVSKVSHDNKTMKCNNFHHRGFCYENCRCASSHGKNLTDNEKSNFKKHVQDLIRAYNETNQTPNASVPNGNPPTGTSST